MFTDLMGCGLYDSLGQLCGLAERFNTDRKRKQNNYSFGMAFLGMHGPQLEANSV